jgi:hypothetical protein
VSCAAVIGSAAAAVPRAMVIPGDPLPRARRLLSLLMAGTVPSIPDDLLPG